MFEIKILSSHRGALSRLVDEAIRIRREGDILLNNKEEYCRNLLPSLTTQTGDKSNPVKPQETQSDRETREKDLREIYSKKRHSKQRRERDET